MTGLGKYLFFGGLFLAALGALLWGAGRLGIPLGKLPGDLDWQGEHTRVYFPIVTCIVLSLLLTLLANFLGRFLR